MGKWWWRFRVEEQSLWVKVIKSVYGVGGGLNIEGIRRWGGKSTWGNIIKSGGDLEKLGIGWLAAFKRRLGDGSTISFWDDNWVGDQNLRERFPRLYGLEVNKEVRVKDRGRMVDGKWVGVWDWHRQPRGRAVGELDDLNLLLQDISLSNECRDKWMWCLDKDGAFSVNALRVVIEAEAGLQSLDPSCMSTLWSNLIPRKICIFTWRALKGRLPVRAMLDEIGIDLNSTLCPWCERMVESLDHCLVNCEMVNPIWKAVFGWWGWAGFNFLHVKDILCHSGHASFSADTKAAWTATLWASCYLIWKNRNDKVFNRKGINNQNLIALIQTSCFNWISHRCKNGNLVWNDWINYPVEATRRLGSMGVQDLVAVTSAANGMVQ